MPSINDLRALETLRYINDVTSKRGYPPSRGEIAHHFGLASRGSGQRLIEALAQKGLVEVFPGRVQGARVTSTGMKALSEELDP